MKKCLFIFLVVLMTASMLIGCAGEKAAEGKVYGKENTNITVNAGETFTVKLDENPTTGYQWSYAVSDENVVALSKDEYAADRTAGDIEGAGGQRVLTFKALSKGTAAIDMVYERSWEKNENDEKLSFQIEVK